MPGLAHPGTDDSPGPAPVLPTAVASGATLVGSLDKRSVMSPWTREDAGTQHAILVLQTLKKGLCAFFILRQGQKRFILAAVRHRLGNHPTQSMQAPAAPGNVPDRVHTGNRPRHVQAA